MSRLKRRWEAPQVDRLSAWGYGDWNPRVGRQRAAYEARKRAERITKGLQAQETAYGNADPVSFEAKPRFANG